SIGRRYPELTIARSTRCVLSLTAASADRKSTRLNSSHMSISYAVFRLKKSRQRNRFHVQQPLGSNVFVAIDAMCVRAKIPRNFDQTIGIGTVFRSHNQ